MEELHDACQDLDVKMEEIALDLSDFQTNYKLAERYIDIDRQIHELFDMYNHIKNYKKSMVLKLQNVTKEIRKLDNEVNSLKLQEFSHAQHGGSYSQLHQNLHR